MPASVKRGASGGPADGDVHRIKRIIGTLKEITVVGRTLVAV
jgi:hypothetical protein